MRAPIEYSYELHPSSSHRTPGEIAEDLAGPIGGFPDHTLRDEPARLMEEPLERTVASGGGPVNFLRARNSTNIRVRAFRHPRKDP